MEGLNIGGILLGYLAVIIFGLAVLIALVLLALRMTRAARILFGIGFFCAAATMCVAVLTFLDPQFHPEGIMTLLVVSSASLFFAGLGPFIAAFRDGRIFLSALGCSAGAIVFLMLIGLGGDAIGGLNLNLPVFVLPVASLMMALASVAFAIFLRFDSQPTAESQEPRERL